MEQEQRQHFMVVIYPAQGHINPGRQLARHFARATGARVTFCTTVSAHRLMFPSLSSPDQQVEYPIERSRSGVVAYVPFSDGHDEPIKQGPHDMKHFKTVGSKNLTNLIQTINAGDCPVTCIIYAILLNWVADIAREQGIPSALFWIQPATVFSIYYHYFHGYEESISSHNNNPSSTVTLPGLLPLQIRDLPSFLSISSPSHPHFVVLAMWRELFKALDKQAELNQVKPKVLVNTFAELEYEALASVAEKIDLIPIGPLLSLPSPVVGGDLFEPEHEKKYMEWLNSKPERSVVYISFGSSPALHREQMKETLKCLKESRKPFLWVARNNNMIEEEDEGEQGMVVEWCSQVKVLSHKSVGCFVTHCGWNSTLESLVYGVPTVCMPQWADQGTNAKLVESYWGTGVRAEVNAGGVLEAAELGRCLEIVMGEEERGKEIRMKTKVWKEKANDVIGEGATDKNLRVFVEEIMK